MWKTWHANPGMYPLCSNEWIKKYWKKSNYRTFKSVKCVLCVRSMLSFQILQSLLYLITLLPLTYLSNVYVLIKLSLSRHFPVRIGVSLLGDGKTAGLPGNKPVVSAVRELAPKEKQKKNLLPLWDMERKRLLRRRFSPLLISLKICRVIPRNIKLSPFAVFVTK